MRRIWHAVLREMKPCHALKWTSGGQAMCLPDSPHSMCQEATMPQPLRLCNIQRCLRPCAWTYAPVQLGLLESLCV